MLGQLNLTVWAWIESLRDLRRIRVWRPFLLLAAAQILVLLLLTQFYRPAFQWLLVPLLERITSAEVLHYPAFYVFLPGIFSQVNLLLDWILGSLVFGAAFLIILHTALGLSDRESWRLAARRYGPLLLVRLPLVLLLIGIAWLLPGWLAQGGVLEGNRLRLVRYGGFLLGVLAEVLFLYAPLLLLAESRSIGRALRGALGLAFRVPLATLLAVLIPNLVQLPTSWVLRRSDVLVRNLAPETVVVLIGVAILAYVFINYFIVASAVRIYGARAAGPGGAA
jgi:hypothetical protein